MGDITRATLFAAAGLAIIGTAAGCGSSSKAAANATGSSTTQAATSTSPGAVAACSTDHLALSLGTPDGAAGHVYLPLIFTNTGTTPCAVTGYPGVSFQTTASGGASVGNAATRQGTGTPATLTLQPGGKASATIDVTQAANFDPLQCVPTPVGGFRVYPPNQFASAFVPYATNACANNSVSTLTVTALVAAN